MLQVFSVAFCIASIGNLCVHFSSLDAEEKIQLIYLDCESTVLEKGIYPFKDISIKIAHLFIMFQNQLLVSLPQVTIDFSGFKLIALSLACRDQY